MRTITIFGSSKPRPGEQEYQEAYELGRSLANAGYTICNGGYGGTMQGSAAGARSAGGKTIGVLCERFGSTPNPYITDVRMTATHSERLHALIELGSAYVILKGSTGTLVELALVWEYMNKSLLQEKPIIVLGDFWKPVISTLKDELVFEGKERAVRFVTLLDSINSCTEYLNSKLK